MYKLCVQIHTLLPGRKSVWYSKGHAKCKQDTWSTPNRFCRLRLTNVPIPSKANKNGSLVSKALSLKIGGVATMSFLYIIFCSLSDSWNALQNKMYIWMVGYLTIAWWMQPPKKGFWLELSFTMAVWRGGFVSYLFLYLFVFFVRFPERKH